MNISPQYRDMITTGKVALSRTWARDDRLKPMCTDKLGEALITQGR